MGEGEEDQRRRPADAEMARVLKTKPLNIVSGLDPSSGGIAHWKHGALHDVVATDVRSCDHDVYRHPSTFAATDRSKHCDWRGTPGVVTIIPAGTSARWDIDGAVDVVQLYLPKATIEASRCRSR